MKRSSKIVFSLTQQQLGLLSNPGSRRNPLGPDSRLILERRGLLREVSYGVWCRTTAGDKVLRALSALGMIDR